MGFRRLARCLVTSLLMLGWVRSVAACLHCGSVFALTPKKALSGARRRATREGGLSVVCVQPPLTITNASSTSKPCLGTQPPPILQRQHAACCAAC